MKLSASSFPPIPLRDFQLYSPLQNKNESNNTFPLQFQGNASLKKALPRGIAMGSLFTSILLLSGLGGKQVKPTGEAPTKAVASNSPLLQQNQPPLTLEETQSLKRIQALALKNPTPTPLIIIADTGAYHDDEGAFVVASQLQKMGLVEIKAVVANLYPSVQRARLTQGTLQQLGLGSVPVGVGSTCGQTTLPKPPEFDVPYMTSNKQPLPTGAMLLKKTLQEAPDKSLTLLLLSGMTDAKDLIAAEPALFKQKVKQVVIMGGVTQHPESFKVLLNEKSLMSPNTAFNNNVDLPAAQTLYEKLQLEKIPMILEKIPMIIVTDEAAFSTPVTPEFYNGFEKTGHPVGKRLKNYQASEMEEVWLKANLAPHDPRREGMAGEFDKKWFLETYCEHPETLKHLGAKDAIWPHVKKICLFDPISVLACSPAVNAHLFKPVLVETQGVTHQIIGLSKKDNGVQDQTELRNVLSALGKSVLAESLPTK